MKNTVKRFTLQHFVMYNEKKPLNYFLSLGKIYAGYKYFFPLNLRIIKYVLRTNISLQSASSSRIDDTQD